MDQFRVFLSAVSSEFGRVRDALANDLQSHDLIVRVQRSFRHDDNAETLLHKLRNYIETCNVVIFLIGSRSGAGFPTPIEAERFRDDLPRGITKASYTQWEMFFARHFRKKCLIYFATDDFERDKPAATRGDRKALQSAFIAHVKKPGPQWTLVGSLHEFRAEVLKDLLRGPLPPEVAAQISAKLAPKPIDLHYPSIRPLFKGRDGFLALLQGHLFSLTYNSAAIACTALIGMGGVGKTRAAVEYAWIHRHRDEYTALFLLDAETPDKLQTALAALAAPLRLPAAAAQEEAVRFEAVLDWLNANPIWLLILDNIDTEPALDAVLRLLGRLAGGHVLMTSRLTQFPRGVETLALDVLNLNDAASFLLDATETGRRRTPDDAFEAHALADALGQLALALEMAAATIKARGWSFTKYQEIWHGNRARVIGWARQEIADYHHAVAETWQTSIDQLTTAGRDLLQRLAFLAPEPLPESLLDVPAPGAPTADDPHAALDDLTKYSLATRDPATETFLLHRLILDVTRCGLTQAGTERDRLTEALGWIDAAFIGDPQDVRTWKVLDPLAAHAEAAAGYADAAGIAKPTADVMGRLATLFHAKALHRRAEPYYKRAIAIAEANFPPNDPRVAIHLNNLAQFLKNTNRLGEAEPLMRRALAIDQASRRPDHPDVAIHLHNLAALLQATNRLGEAEPLMHRALSIAEAFYGPFHPSVAIHLNGLAQILQAAKRLDEAEPLMRRALAIAEASHDPHVTTHLNNLARLLQDTRRFDEAELLMRRALAIDEASYGPKHPRVAIRLNNLARLLQDTDRLDEAEPLSRRHLAIFLAL
jgi:tetratricopeptide (TPR) repeat protein